MLQCVRVTAYQAAPGDLIGTYTIVEAGTITGTFSGVDNKLALLDVELNYITENRKDLVTLTAKAKTSGEVDKDPNLLPEVKPHSRNQRAVGGAYDSLPSGDLKSAIITAAGSNPAQFFDMLSGEIHPSLQGLLQDSDRRLAAKLRARTIDREKAPKGSPLWLNVDGYSSRTDRTSSTASTKLEGFEANLGAEMNKTEWTAGAVLRYADSDVKAGRRNSKAEIQSLGAGLYAGRNWDNFYLSFGATFAFHDVETKRGVAGNNFYQRLDGDYDVKTFQLFSEVGYFMPILDNLVLGPYAGLSWNSAENESFTEKGGNMALHAKNESNENLVSTVGVRAKTKALDKFSIEADLNWQHIYDEVNPESRFFLNGSDQFSVWGAPMNRDSVGLSLNATMKLTPSLNIRAGYDGRFGNSAEAHAGGLTLEFSF